MPGFDGTGPAGTGQGMGRGFGRCRCGQARGDIIIPPEKTNENAVPQEGQQVSTQALETVSQPAFSGVGRGRIARGCGRGFCGGRRSPSRE